MRTFRAGRHDGPMRRRYGSGSIFPLKNGHWRAQVTVVRPDGRRRQITRTTPTYDEAKGALRRLNDALARETDPGQRTTLEAYLATWLADVEPSVRPSTYRSYAGHVREHIDPLLGGIDLDRLRASDVARLVRQMLDKGRAPATVQRVLVTLSMALDAAIRQGLAERNVVKLVRRPKVEREPVAALRVDRARAILAAVADDRDGALYVLLLGSGMRLGEALALDWDDIDLPARTVRIRQGKTARARRIVPIPAFAVAALRAHQARQATIAGPVFLGMRGGRLRADLAYHRFQRLLDAARLPRMRVHDLRHAAATLMLASGMDMRYLADQLGHADASLTARVYAHVIPELQRAGVERLDEVL
ncbi:MAG TPA: tyrosine-type recombinase/integrase [Streptosporangiaceae bacterium]|nr:tyrosine-type recombinase/integrase [Streptosporangiaceae bacterium]